jgi:hypothetical protein
MLKDTTDEVACILFDITVSVYHTLYFYWATFSATKNNEFNALLFLALGSSDTRLLYVLYAPATYQMI